MMPASKEEEDIVVFCVFCFFEGHMVTLLQYVLFACLKKLPVYPELLLVFVALHLASQLTSVTNIIVSYFQWHFQQVDHAKQYGRETNMEKHCSKSCQQQLFDIGYSLGSSIQERNRLNWMWEATCTGPMAKHYEILFASALFIAHISCSTRSRSSLVFQAFPPLLCYVVINKVYVVISIAQTVDSCISFTE